MLQRTNKTIEWNSVLIISEVKEIKFQWSENNKKFIWICIKKIFFFWETSQSAWNQCVFDCFKKFHFIMRAGAVVWILWSCFGECLCLQLITVFETYLKTHLRDSSTCAWQLPLNRNFKLLYNYQFIDKRFNYRIIVP